MASSTIESSPLLPKLITSSLLKPLNRLKIAAFQEAMPLLFANEITGEKNREFIIKHFVSIQDIEDESKRSLLNKINDYVTKQLSLFKCEKVSEELIRYKSLGILKASVKSILDSSKDIEEEKETEDEKNLVISDFVEKFNKNFQSRSHDREEALQILESLKNNAWIYEQGVPKIPKASEVASTRNGIFLMYQCKDSIVKERALTYLTELLECDPLFMETAYDLVDLQKGLLQEIEVNKAQNLNTKLQRLLIKAYAISLECILLHAASQNLNALANETKQEIWTGAETLAKFNIVADEEIKFWTAYAVQGAQHIKTEVTKVEEWFLRIALIVRSGMQIASAVFANETVSPMDAFSSALSDLKAAVFHIEWQEKWFEKLLVLKKLCRYSYYDVYTFRKVAEIIQQFKREVSRDLQGGGGATGVAKGIVTQDLHGLQANENPDINLFYGVVAVMEHTALHSTNPVIQEEAIKLLLQYIMIDQSSVQRRVISAFTKMLGADTKLKNTGFVILKLLQASDYIRFDDARTLLDQVSSLYSNEDTQLCNTDVFENAVKFLLRRLVRAQGDQDFGGHSLFTLMSAFSGEQVFPKIFSCINRLFGNLRESDMHGNTPFHIATRKGNILLISSIHQCMNIDINAQDYANLNTALHLAAENDDLEAVAELVKVGADLNIQNKFGDTPLHIAARKKFSEIVQFLVQKGADPKILNYNGHAPLPTPMKISHVKNPLIDSSDDGIEAQFKQMIELAGKPSKVESLKKYLKKLADIDCANEAGVTLLHAAVASQNSEAVEMILLKGANPNVKDLHGCTPLHYAAYLNNLALIKRLLEAKADPNGKNHFGETPLLMAAGKLPNREPETLLSLVPKPAISSSDEDKLNIIKTLIENKADIDAVDLMDNNALHHAVYGENISIIHYFFHEAMHLFWKKNRKGLLPVEEVIRSIRGLDIGAIIGEYSLKKLHDEFIKKTQNKLTLGNLLILAHEFEIFKKLIKEAPDAATHADAGHFRQTPLHIAAENGYDLVLTLYTVGKISLIMKDANGNTPAHIAAANSQSDFIAKLIQGKADLRIANQDGRNCLHLAAAKVETESVGHIVKAFPGLMLQADGHGNLPIHAACKYEKIENLKILFHAHPDSISTVNDDGNTPLHMACFNKNIDCAKFLLVNGAELESKNIFGITPLVLAAECSSDVMVDFLLDRGADLRTQDDDGETALHKAILNQDLATVKILLTKEKTLFCPKENALVNIFNNSHETALHQLTRKNPEDEANHKEQVEILEMLYSMGASLKQSNSYGETILHLICYHGFNHLLAHLIGKLKVKKNKLLPDIFTVLDHRSNTILHKACEGNQLESCKTLLKIKYDKEKKNSEGMTPLLVAAQKGFTEIAKFLMDNGADCTAVNKKGQNILHLILMHEELNPELFLLLRKLIVRKPKLLLARDQDKTTPLHILALNNHSIVLDLIIENVPGTFKERVTFVYQKTREGLTAIDIANQRNFHDLARMLNIYPKDHLGSAHGL